MHHVVKVYGGVDVELHIDLTWALDGDKWSTVGMKVRWTSELSWVLWKKE
jgi:hypothetical protein